MVWGSKCASGAGAPLGESAENALCNFFFPGLNINITLYITDKILLSGSPNKSSGNLIGALYLDGKAIADIRCAFTCYVPLRT